MTTIRRSAVQSGIERLYHYEPFTPEYLLDTLRQRRVHCSDPAALNDPWDCRPWFCDDALQDPTSVEELIQWFFSFPPREPVSDDVVKATQHEMRTNAAYRRAILERFSKDFLAMIPNRWRIYCVTPVPDSTLMWSHYGDNHKGICLEFGTDNEVFGSAQEVEYRSDYPTWAPHLVADQSGPGVLFTKSDDWKYEREYRILGLSEGIDRPVKSHPLFLKGEFLRIPDSALKSVVVGCEAKYDEVIRTVELAAPHLPIKHAIRSPNRYRLQIS